MRKSLICISSITCCIFFFVFLHFVDFYFVFYVGGMRVVTVVTIGNTKYSRQGKPDSAKLLLRSRKIAKQNYNLINVKEIELLCISNGVNFLCIPRWPLEVAVILVENVPSISLLWRRICLVQVIFCYGKTRWMWCMKVHCKMWNFH